MSKSSRAATRIHKQAVGIINSSIRDTGKSAADRRGDAMRGLKDKRESLKANFPNSEVKGKGTYLSDLCDTRKIPEKARGKGKIHTKPMKPENIQAITFGKDR